jgi:hypothetical protein
MKNLIFSLALGALFYACSGTGSQESTETTTETPAQAAPEEPQSVSVVSDTKYVEMAQKGLAAMTAQSIEDFTASFTDQSMYIFNAGDTLKGLETIKGYWSERMKVIDEISFSNEVWLTVEVSENNSQNVVPGVWLLAWFNVDATYTSGGSMNQNIHTLYHFTENDEIDVIIQYLDRVPIMQAQEGS